MTPDTKRFGDVELTFDASCEDAASAAFNMLAKTLSMLVAKERHARLEEIENGALRSLVAGFVTARMLRSLPPYPPAKQSNGSAT
jgi:hypothetical protein